LIDIRSKIPDHINLVCVSKFHPVESIQEAYDFGERIFGESKVQELTEKQSVMPNDIKWHFIGHLQTNKVKYIVPFIELIHGVDSEKLLSEINNQALKINRRINCLLQIHIAKEETKFGFSSSEVIEFITSDRLKNYPFVNVCGLMGMATFSNDADLVKSEFKNLKNLFEKIKELNINELINFNQISMGMSDDFQFAIEEGSTMVRIGSLIFGNRNYLV
jgi:pyridoxal phosphate enzyme (YggS family)